MLKSILLKFTGISFIMASVFGFSACPKRISGGYEVKNGKVIFNEGMKGLGTTNSFEVEGADPKSFKAINRRYGKDNQNAYLFGKAIPNSDGATFELIEDFISKDKNHVYFSSQIVSNRPQNFKILFKLNTNSGKSKIVYSADGEKIYSGKTPFLPDLVDVATFERIGKTRFLRDKNRVYLYSRVIEEADPKSFTSIGRHGEIYAKDKSNIFYSGRIVEGADVESHRIIDKFHHKDKQNVYFRRNILSDDPKSFEVLSKAYTKDSKNVYWRTKKISEDTEKFKVFPSKRLNAYAKDSKNAFWGWKLMEDVDVESFVGLNHNYAKDKNKVYFAVNNFELPQVLKKADAESFELVEGEKGIDAKDKNNNYSFGTVRRKKK